jgi:cytosine/adenosine deaminase-related metal-dependent hydrolase
MNIFLDDRLRYAITPRFAPTCSDDQLARAGDLPREFPDLYLHTHLAENVEEVAWVQEIFPQCAGYLDVYAHFGLLGKRSIFAHCIHLSDDEFKLLHQNGSGIAFCPTSNLFLGSGLFKPGKEADFVVLDYRATPILDLRLANCKHISDRLFALAMLGDDRVIKATYIMGNEAYRRKA